MIKITLNYLHSLNEFRKRVSKTFNIESNRPQAVKF